ncbi:MAG: hypothetical protein MUO63_00760 [Desulfobulbaceae bacterium]|nr:hypothetical protein [Desulfobulbaceae bacterium]
METRSLKALSMRFLQGNHQGNQKETESFPKETSRKHFGNFKETTPAPAQVAKRAEGYGCGACGGKVYRQVTVWETRPLPPGSEWKYEHRPEVGWQCENCETVYPIIGGSRGPDILFNRKQ